MKPSLRVLAILIVLILPMQVEGLQDSWVVSRPWGLGLTIPNGSLLEDGTTVEWSKHSNITVVFSLPNITYTDNTIYLIVSVMTNSGTIIQVAAGIDPNSTIWSTYIMYVIEICYRNKTYIPVKLNDIPYFSPRDRVAISIYNKHLLYNSVKYWASSVTNLSTGEKIDIDILIDNSSTFKDGEQEVIALESYTYNENIFRFMGEATLHSILVDGKRIINGWYIDDGQVFDKRPLFEVGGGQVPSFITLIFKEDGNIVWTYSEHDWNNSSNPVLVMFFVSTLITFIIIAFYVAYRVDYRNQLRKKVTITGVKHTIAPTTVAKDRILKGFMNGSKIERTVSTGACMMFR